MTSCNCLTGTDRVYEASCQIDADIYINVQGDEPLFNPKDIQIILEASSRQPEMIINGMCPISDEQDYYSPHVPKVVTDPEGQLLYMSRGSIPSNKKHNFVSAMRQVCIYAYPKMALRSFALFGKKSPLEAQEDIEILRFLEIGYRVLMIEVSQSSIPIDIPEDVARVLQVINQTQ